MVKVLDIEVKGRWQVLFSDEGRWRVGIYVPEFTSRDEVDVLERHDRPELFYLIRGKVVLLLSSDGREIVEVPMDPNKLYIVTEWHNAYRPGGCEGVVLVVEGTDIKTEFLRIRS